MGGPIDIGGLIGRSGAYYPVCWIAADRMVAHNKVIGSFSHARSR